LPLGIGIGHGQYEATRVRLPRGSTVVLYTDGLVESPAADINSGMASLARALATTGPLSLKEACDTLLSCVTSQPADDIAILLARTS
jgi:serine phosphatase RsbU (regulator of sigma subunit)